MHRDCPLDCKVYVGNLGNSGSKAEIERAFGYYGPLRSVWVARTPPGFAFVEFEDPRDAADAVRELDGRTMCGCPVRVELSNGQKRSRDLWSRRPRDSDDYRRRSPPARRRATTMPLLTTLRVNQLVLFQRHVTADPHSAWLVLLHDPGMASHQVAPAHWFLSMPFSTFSSFSLNPNGSGPPHIPNHQHLASPIQPVLPTRPPVCQSFIISSLLKSKNTNLHAGGFLAAVEAETGGGRGPSLGTGTTNFRGPFHALGVAQDLMTENKTMAVRCKGS